MSRVRWRTDHLRARRWWRRLHTPMNRDEGSGCFASRIQRSVVRHVLVSGGVPTAFAAGERGSWRTLELVMMKANSESTEAFEGWNKN